MALKKLTNNWSLRLRPLHHPYGHVIKILAFGNQHVFTKVAMSQGHVITMCDLPIWLLTSNCSGMAKRTQNWAPLT